MENESKKLKLRDLKGWQSVFLYKTYCKMLLSLLPYTRIKLKDYSKFIEALEELTEQERRIIFAEIIIFCSDDEFTFLASALEDKNGVELSSMNVGSFTQDEIVSALVDVFESQYKVGREGFFLPLLSGKKTKISE